MAGSLHVVGAGLVGGSVALAAVRAGWRVTVEDVDPDAARSIARRLDAGSEAEIARGGTSDAADLVVVAVPPEDVAAAVIAALDSHVHASVTDVCSVKARPLSEIESSGADITRYVPGHPLAGRERGGASAARADLFDGRSWVLCPGAAPVRHDLVTAFVTDLGATPVLLSADQHDAALALTSHLPQVLASALAAVVGDRFPSAAAAGRSVLEPSDVVGPALLDMTRLAASPAELWATIAAANAVNLAGAVRAVREILEPYERDLAEGSRAAAATEALVRRGAVARKRIAAKHHGGTGAASAPAPVSVDAPRLGAFGDDDSWAWVEVAVPDAPGALAELFARAAGLQINIEDIQVDHAPHRAAGLVRLAVRSADEDALRAAFLPTDRQIDKSS